ncbi:Sec23-binding domain of Sec16-domain-containing protein [Gorgonomyces haynaldii]|nr:Sec23-binding domain of Sec16-domain-containing protein [Gorgonomyces haynaldii]
MASNSTFQGVPPRVLKRPPKREQYKPLSKPMPPPELFSSFGFGQPQEQDRPTPTLLKTVSDISEPLIVAEIAKVSNPRKDSPHDLSNPFEGIKKTDSAVLDPIVKEKPKTPEPVKQFDEFVEIDPQQSFLTKPVSFKEAPEVDDFDDLVFGDSSGRDNQQPKQQTFDQMASKSPLLEPTKASPRTFYQTPVNSESLEQPKSPENSLPIAKQVFSPPPVVPSENLRKSPTPQTLKSPTLSSPPVAVVNKSPTLSSQVPAAARQSPTLASVPVSQPVQKSPVAQFEQLNGLEDPIQAETASTAINDRLTASMISGYEPSELNSVSNHPAMSEYTENGFTRLQQDQMTDAGFQTIASQETWPEEWNQPSDQQPSEQWQEQSSEQWQEQPEEWNEQQWQEPEQEWKENWQQDWNQQPQEEWPAEEQYDPENGAWQENAQEWPQSYDQELPVQSEIQQQPEIQQQDWNQSSGEMLVEQHQEWQQPAQEHQQEPSAQEHQKWNQQSVQENQEWNPQHAQETQDWNQQPGELPVEQNQEWTGEQNQEWNQQEWTEEQWDEDQGQEWTDEQQREWLAQQELPGQEWQEEYPQETQQWTDQGYQEEPHETQQLYQEQEEYQEQGWTEQETQQWSEQQEWSEQQQQEWSQEQWQDGQEWANQLPDQPVDQTVPASEQQWEQPTEQFIPPPVAAPAQPFIPTPPVQQFVAPPVTVPTQPFIPSTAPGTQPFVPTQQTPSAQTVKPFIPQQTFVPQLPSPTKPSAELLQDTVQPLKPFPQLLPHITPKKTQSSPPVLQATPPFQPNTMIPGAVTPKQKQFKSGPHGDPLGRDYGHSVAVFGFGGQMLLIRPIRQTVYVTGQNGTPVSYEKSYPGQVQLTSTSLLVHKQVLEQASGKPLLHKKLKQKQIEELIQKASLTHSTLLCDYLMSCLQKDFTHFTKSLGPFDFGSFESTQLHQLLLEGKRKEACDFCMSMGLWDHALVIATHVDKQTYTNVVSGFSKQLHTEKKPVSIDSIGLRVLYNVFGGAGPKSILEFLDKSQQYSKTHIAHWRMVLALLLSNRTQGDASIFTTLGEQLHGLGETVAGQLCTAASGTADQGLLLNPRKPLSPSVIHINEIFELVQVHLNVNLTHLPSLQPYKFWYCLYLSDLGLIDLSLEYLESIAKSKQLHQMMGVFQDRISIMFKKTSKQESQGFFSNFTGAALGRGLESLMNSAVGVEEKKPSDSPSSLYPVPRSDYTASPLAQAVSGPQMPAFSLPQVTHQEAFANQPTPPVVPVYHTQESQQTVYHIQESQQPVYQQDYAQEQYQQDYPQQQYQEQQYQKQSQEQYQEGYQEEYAQQDYAQGDYQQQYTEGQYQQEYAQGEYQQYGEGEYTGDYQEGYQQEYQDYSQDQYQQEQYDPQYQQEQYEGEYQQEYAQEYQGEYQQEYQSQEQYESEQQYTQEGYQQQDYTQQEYYQEGFAQEYYPEQEQMPEEHSRFYDSVEQLAPETDQPSLLPAPQSVPVEQPSQAPPVPVQSSDPVIPQPKSVPPTPPLSQGAPPILQPSAAAPPIPQPKAAAPPVIPQPKATAAPVIPFMPQQELLTTADKPPKAPSKPPTPAPLPRPKSPAKTTQSAPSLNQDDDLGLGNAGLKKNESNNSVKSEPKEELKKSDSKGSGIFGIFGSFFGKKEDAVPKAHLPSGSSFYFDKDLNRWVNKNASASAEPEQKAAPPPVTTSAPASTNPSRTASPMPGQPKKKGARSRYVDIMNPDAVDEPKQVNSFMVSQQGAAKMMMVFHLTIAYCATTNDIILHGYL